MLTHALCGLQNNPLYIEAFEATTEEEILRFHNIAHCSLDAVEKALEEDKGMLWLDLPQCTIRLAKAFIEPAK